MFKPLTRSRKSPRASGGFAETQFLHAADEDDYSGFAPTEMFGDDEVAPLADPVVPATPSAARAAALAREAQAHQAAHQARAVIAAQRRAGETAPDAAPAAPRSVLARLRAAFARLLPGGLLTLFVGVSVTMATISAVLPMIDRP